MPDFPLVTNEGAAEVLSVLGPLIADAGAGPPAIVSKLRLFDGTLNPTVDTTEAEFVAAETALVGYPVGGYDITDIFGPIAAPGGGFSIYANMVNVAYASGAAVSIGGYWVEDAAGNVIGPAQVFDPPRTLATITDGFPIVWSLGYGRQTV